MIGDDKHNFLKCTDCDKTLIDVVITRPCQGVTFGYLALCPFCGGQSALKTIEGLVHIGSVPGTKLKDMKTDTQKVVVVLSKE